MYMEQESFGKETESNKYVMITMLISIMEILDLYKRSSRMVLLFVLMIEVLKDVVHNYKILSWPMRSPFTNHKGVNTELQL